MNRLYFDYPFDLVDTITALLGNMNDDYPVISVYGKYGVIKDILEDLIASCVSISNEIELQDYDVAHYNKEFVLYLTTDGVNVEKAYDIESDTYLSGGADISFIHDGCSSKLIKYVDSKTVYEFGYDEDEEECDCDECECDCCKDEKTVATSTSSTTYKVNDKEVDKETYEKALNELDEKYLDNIQDMLLNYSDFVSEMNQWRRLLGW